MSKEQSNPILGAIDNINTAFEQFKTTNDERLEAEGKGNQARAKELNEKLDKIEVDITAGEKRRREEERKEALREERIEILEAANDRPKASIEEKIKGEYSDQFVKFVRSGFSDQEAAQEMKSIRTKAAGMKAVNIGTDSAGGHAVPEEISRNIDKLMLRQSDVLQNIRTFQVGTSDYKELITINSAAAAWISETGSRVEQTTPELRQVAPTFGELYSYLFATSWSLQDVFFNVEDWLTENTAEQMAKAVDLAVFSGNGTNKPTGLTASAPVATADTASPIRAAAAFEYIPTDSASPQAFGGDDVFDLVYALNRAYRPNAKFGCNQNTQAAIRKLKDTTNQYLWEPSLQVGQPARLVGYELFTYEDMGDPTVADALYLAFGDWRKAYTLPFRQQLEITVDNNITTPGTVKFYIRRRYGGIVANNDALKFLKLADS